MSLARIADELFQSTLPAWGETGMKEVMALDHRFQSTLPAWGETWEDRGGGDPEGRISIHSPRMGRDPARDRCQAGDAISIHSPRMGRDERYIAARVLASNFNPLSPHGERLMLSRCLRRKGLFQSTLPAWGETATLGSCSGRGRDFNPLSPHGERPDPACRDCPARISIHSPRMGRDDAVKMLAAQGFISIHSPRMGRDAGAGKTGGGAGDFNPLSPHGERLAVQIVLHHRRQFQSTLPAWGETQNGRGFPRPLLISIHSPRMGRDPGERPPPSAPTYFNPLSPHGERRSNGSMRRQWQKFQSTLPAWGETVDDVAIFGTRIFQSTLPAWGETRSQRGRPPSG